MDWPTLIEDNFAALLTLLGVLVGLLGALGQIWLTKREELKHKQLDAQNTYREKNLVLPVIEFSDTILQMLDNAYWNSLDGEIYDTSKVLKQHRDKESITKARILAFGDQKLIEAFDNLSINYGRFWNHLGENKLVEAFDAKEDAYKQVGILLDRMKPHTKS